MQSTQLNLEIAQTLIDKVIMEAKAAKLEMAAYVVDTSGHPLAFIRMDGVSYIAMEVSRRKATTACNLKMPTQFISQINNIDSVVAADLAKNPEICAVPGGMPIMLGQKCVGGLGVAGGRSEQDQAIAEKALAALA